MFSVISDIAKEILVTREICIPCKEQGEFRSWNDTILSKICSCIFFSDDWRVKLHNWHWNGFHWPAMWSSPGLPNLARLFHKLPLPIWPRSSQRFADLAVCLRITKRSSTEQLLLFGLISFLLPSSGLHQGGAEGSVACLSPRGLEALSFLEGHAVDIPGVCTKHRKMGTFLWASANLVTSLLLKNNMGIDSDREQDTLVLQLSLVEVSPLIKKPKQAKGLDGYSVCLIGFKALIFHWLLCDPC